MSLAGVARDQIVFSNDLVAFIQEQVLRVGESDCACGLPWGADRSIQIHGIARGTVSELAASRKSGAQPTFQF
jgi:hypothetical protein